MRRIYAQGDFDGACFLYSIINAYVALRQEEPEFAAVCKAFGQVDWPGDFLNGMTGTTGSYNDDYGMLAENIRRVLSLVGGEHFRVTRIPGQFSESMLGDCVRDKSVLMVRYTGNSKHAAGMDHWVCVVDYDRQNFNMHIACSVRMNRACNGLACEYAESFHERYGRWSNDILLAGSEHAIVAEEMFQISIRS